MYMYIYVYIDIVTVVNVCDKLLRRVPSLLLFVAQTPVGHIVIYSDQISFTNAKSYSR